MDDEDEFLRLLAEQNKILDGIKDALEDIAESVRPV